MTLPTRIGALGLAASLTATGLSLLSSPATAAGVDPAPSATAAAWLRANLAGASVPDALEAALGLKVAGDPTTAGQLLTSTAATSGTYTGLPADRIPDATARTAWYVQQLGGDATNYGTSGNLITALDTLVDSTGRLGDDAVINTPAPTVAGQIFAASALATAGNLKAVTYTAGLQCAAGYFNDALPAVAPAPQVCDPTAGKASVPATALFAIGMRDVAAAQPAVTKALDWLVSQQGSNGRWVANGAAGNGSGDAISTALAGYALALKGRPAPAAQGAIWLRGNQFANAGSCPAFLAGDVGAVAPDGNTYPGTAGRVPDFRLSTARSLLILGGAPGGPGVTDNLLTVPRFSKPGRTVKATVRTAPRNVICASAPTLPATRIAAGYDSTADFSFTAGASGVTTASIVDQTGQVDTASVTVLGKKKLGLKFRSKRVRFAKTAVVKVSGLAAGERVKVFFRGKSRNSAIANSAGQAKLRFIVTGKRGFVPVRVVGEYNNRNRVKNLIVVRR